MSWMPSADPILGDKRSCDAPELPRTGNGDVCLLRFKRYGQVAAVALIFRDLESLQGEVMMEREVTS